MFAALAAVGMAVGAFVVVVMPCAVYGARAENGVPDEPWLTWDGQEPGEFA